nr:hypothetical protein [Tanacetum cinerariifolium]
MRTRSKSYPNNFNATIPRRSNRRRVPNIVEPGILTIEEVVPMDDRTMEELLQAPTEGDVPNDAIKLMFFPYSLEGAARIWVAGSSGTDLAKITKKGPKPGKNEHEIEKIAQKPDPKTFSLH